MTWLPDNVKNAVVPANSVKDVNLGQPPCKDCKFWMPRKASGTVMDGAQYRFCWSPHREPDFSCFEAKT